MKTFQYNDRHGKFDPEEDTGETKWIAAPSVENADAYAAAHGWEQSGGMIFDDNQTARMIEYGADKAGIDVVLQVRDDARFTGPERRAHHD